MNGINLVLDVLTSKTILFILAMILLVLGYIKFKIWNFKRKYGCSDTENFIFMVNNGESGGDKFGIWRWEADIFNLEKDIYLSNIFQKRSEAAFRLPFKINLPVFKGKPRLEVEQNMRCVVEKIDSLHLTYKFVGDFYFWNDNSSKFVKYHHSPTDSFSLCESYIEHIDLVKGDEFKFTFDKEGKLTIKKIPKDAPESSLN